MLKVKVKVFDCFKEQNEEGVTTGRRHFVFGFVISCSSLREAEELSEFARNLFEMSSVRDGSNWHTGIRMAYLGMRSAFYFEGFKTEVDACIKNA